MKVLTVKPDYGTLGGFEIVLGKIEKELESRGHTVERLGVPVGGLGRSAFGVDIPEEIYPNCHEYFRYMAMVEAFRSLAATNHDLVISTQPPSFMVSHPKHLALFYHHLRIYYDLSDIYLRAGFVNLDLHLAAQHAVRKVDEEPIASVGWFAAPQMALERLATYNDITENVSLFNATTDLAERMLLEGLHGDFHNPLCVSRHEFPKRAELFVHAMKFVPNLKGRLIGAGGRFDWVRFIDSKLSNGEMARDAVHEADLWLNTGELDASTLELWKEAGGNGISNVELTTLLDEAELQLAYLSALCVVAPAYDEDYGLTAIEAMACGKPVIVCEDGGGLERMVSHGVNGFVVKPTGQAIADAIQTLSEDRALAERMGNNGRLMAHEFSWPRAMEQFIGALEAIP